MHPINFQPKRFAFRTLNWVGSLIRKMASDVVDLMPKVNSSTVMMNTRLIRRVLFRGNRNNKRIIMQ
jgi:hypothetical protein